MLPSAFLSRMRTLLGPDFPAFLHAMTEEPPCRGCRVNPVKADPDAFRSRPPFPVRPIPYTPDGFYHSVEKLGHHPFHHAGILYSQDPGAMSTLCALSLPRGIRALDLCAAPGGKTAQIAAAIGADGCLVSNDCLPPRARQLVSNTERLGLANTLVTCTEPAVLAGWFPAFFDFVLVDAPCSGEGMFRKNPEAIEDWSEEKVRRCAALQGELLSYAADMLRPGGTLLYSTCTFSLEENEAQIDAFLIAHPTFRLCRVSDALAEATVPGIAFPGCKADLTRTRRFYPHIAPGEGQYIALLRREEDGDPPGTVTYRDASLSLKPTETAAVEAFLRENCLHGEEYAKRVRSWRGVPVLPPDGFPLPPHGVYAAGCTVGELRGKRLVPHHRFFTTYGSDFCRRLSLDREDVRLAAYLHGDTFPAPELTDGYAAVLLEGAPLGGIRVVEGQAKNLYPKGLRRP